MILIQSRKSKCKLFTRSIINVSSVFYVGDTCVYLVSMLLSSLKFELLFPEKVDCVTESPTPSKDSFPSPRPHVSMRRFPWPPIIMLQEI